MPGADAGMPICAPSSDSSASASSGLGARVWVLHGLALGAAAAAAAVAYLYRRPTGFRSRAVGIIPARFASTRFEGKPLVPILGKPMIQVRLLLADLDSSHLSERARWVGDRTCNSRLGLRGEVESNCAVSV